MDNNELILDSINIAVVGYLIVFTALVALYLFFQYLPKVLNLVLNRKPKSILDKKGLPRDAQNISVEENAAISAAIFMFFNELHDDENTKLTIDKVSRIYSPWSSKIYATHKPNKYTHQL